MTTDHKELQMLQELGFGVENGRIVKLASSLSTDDLKYAGFGIYVSADNKVFEKQGEELVEVTDDEIAAEQRFFEKNYA